MIQQRTSLVSSLYPSYPPHYSSILLCHQKSPLHCILTTTVLRPLLSKHKILSVRHMYHWVRKMTTKPGTLRRSHDEENVFKVHRFLSNCPYLFAPYHPHPYSLLSTANQLHTLIRSVSKYIMSRRTCACTHTTSTHLTPHHTYNNWVLALRRPVPPPTP